MKPARLLVSCLALGAMAGCTVNHHHAPGEVVAAPQEPVAEAEAPTEEAVVEDEVVEEVVEVEQDEASVVYVEIDLTPEYRRFRGDAAANFNTGYVDGWAAASFFNHGRPLADHQIDRLITVGRRQGDPTGKLSLPGYEAGYRCGAKHVRNPYRRRMTMDQVVQLRRAQGLPQRELVVRPGREFGRGGGRGLRNETHVHVDTRDNGRHDRKPQWTGRRDAERAENERKAREAELEAARLKAETQQKELEAARLKRQTDRIEKIEELKDKREMARDQRKAELEAKEAERKAKLEQARKEREAEAKRLELARLEREAKLKAELEAAKAKRDAAAKEREMARDQRNADLKAKLDEKKEDREAQRDQRTADRKQKVTDLKQRLADKKAQREAEKKAEASARD